MTDITFGDKMGSKVMTLKPFSYQENYFKTGYRFKVSSEKLEKRGIDLAMPGTYFDISIPEYDKSSTDRMPRV